MTKVIRRPHRDGYFWVSDKSDPKDGGVAFYVESVSKWFGHIRQWCVDSGFAQPQTPISTTDGQLCAGVDFGLGVDSSNLIRWGRIQRASIEIKDKARVSWTEDAKELCDRYERKLYELFEFLDAAQDAKTARDAEMQALKAKLSDAERTASRANTVADELRQRAKEIDIDRLRRDFATELSQKMEALLEENRRLAAELYEVTSQVTKLTEDKRRLRAALNTARK